MNWLLLFVHFVLMQITERAELYQHFDYLQQLSMIFRPSPRVHGYFSEPHSTGEVSRYLPRKLWLCPEGKEFPSITMVGSTMIS